MDMTNKRILITGGFGFVGSHLRDELEDRGCRHIIRFHKRQCDLTDQADVWSMLRRTRPEVVFHLAATVGGIGANQKSPGQFLYDNAMMGLHMLEECRQVGVEKIILLGTVCSYPKLCPVPFREDDLWDGYPEDTNAPYGVAKKMLLTAAQAYRQQYGMNVITLIPVNLFGPRDHFDAETSHVIPALIKKCVDAKRAGDEAVELWGDGSPTREFLYVKDAVKAIATAAQIYDEPDPINLGTGQEIAIRELARIIAREVGYHGAFAWDRTRPNGQPRRCLDVTRAQERLGWNATTSLEHGIRETIAWYGVSRPRSSVPALVQSA